VRFLIAKIDAEIFSQTEKKERRQKAHAQQMRCADISSHRDRLAKENNHPVVPVLTEFRRLPIITALQDRDDAPHLSDANRSSSTKLAKSRVLESELKHSELIGGMINSDIKKWTDTARVAFNSILGQPNWKSASTTFLHPAERVTARFVCTLCSKRPNKDTTVESLTFIEACAHHCPRCSTKSAGKQKWKADQFVPDKKAINVLSQAISLLGLKAERRETKDKVENVGPRFLCKSCDSPILMNFQRLAGHCHRHDGMQVGLASMADREFRPMRVEHPYDVGSFARYTSKTKEAKEMRQMKVFGCRHCLYRSPGLENVRASHADINRRKRFTLVGLISHAKEKHKIFPLGDEDFFRDDVAVVDDVRQA